MCPNIVKDEKSNFITLFLEFAKMFHCRNASGHLWNGRERKRAVLPTCCSFSLGPSSLLSSWACLTLTVLSAQEPASIRRTKEPLDESERGQWKSWLKAQHSENEDYGIWSHHFMGNRWGKQWKQCQTLFFWAPKSLQMVIAAMKLKDAYSLEGKLWPT